MFDADGLACQIVIECKQAIANLHLLYWTVFLDDDVSSQKLAWHESYSLVVGSVTVLAQTSCLNTAVTGQNRGKDEVVVCCDCPNAQIFTSDQTAVPISKMKRAMQYDRCRSVVQRVPKMNP